MIVPPVSRWLAGEEVDAETLTQRASDIISFLEEPPQAQARATVAQSIPNATWTIVAIDTTDKDNDGIVNLSTDRLTIVTPGWYEVIINCGFDTVDATQDPKGRRVVAFRLNGTSTNGGYRSRADAVAARSGANTVRSGGQLSALFLNTGDYIQLMAYQNSSVARNTYVGDITSQPYISVRWVSN